MTTVREDFYAILEISRTATAVEIKRAHTRLIKLWHPDVNASPEATARAALINRARDVLLDPRQRGEYDTGRAASSSPRASNAPPTPPRPTRPGPATTPAPKMATPTVADVMRRWDQVKDAPPAYGDSEFVLWHWYADGRDVSFLVVARQGDRVAVYFRDGTIKTYVAEKLWEQWQRHLTHRRREADARTRQQTAQQERVDWERRERERRDRARDERLKREAEERERRTRLAEERRQREQVARAEAERQSEAARRHREREQQAQREQEEVERRVRAEREQRLAEVRRAVEQQAREQAVEAAAADEATRRAAAISADAARRPAAIPARGPLGWHDHAFVAGHWYEGPGGVYQVVALADGRVTTRYPDGAEETLEAAALWPHWCERRRGAMPTGRPAPAAAPPGAAPAESDGEVGGWSARWTEAFTTPDVATPRSSVPPADVPARAAEIAAQFGAPEVARYLADAGWARLLDRRGDRRSLALLAQPPYRDSLDALLRDLKKGGLPFVYARGGAGVADEPVWLTR